MAFELRRALADVFDFPKFQSAGESFVNVMSFSDDTRPATNGDAAKALIWAFVAGFAERFVPNFLDRLTNGAEEPRADARKATDAPKRRGKTAQGR